MMGSPVEYSDEERAAVARALAEEAGREAEYLARQEERRLGAFWEPVLPSYVASWEAYVARRSDQEFLAFLRQKIEELEQRLNEPST